MVKRKNFISNITKNVLNNIPSWMKLREKDSNGYPFINNFAQELERIGEQFDENYNDLFIKTTNSNQIDNLYIADSRNYVNLNNITGSGTDGIVKINVVKNNYDLFNAKSTRVEYKGSELLSGISSGTVISGLININYFYNYLSGYYYVIPNATAIDPSSVLIYNDSTQLINKSCFASGRQDYDDNGGYYEIIQPDTSGELVDKYPLLRLITSGLPGGGVTKLQWDPHYTPQASSGWDNSWYYNDNGELKYHFTRLNNPYGSGTYNLSSGILLNTPIEGTIKVYDILNLDASGEPVLIPATGATLYKYTSPSGEFTYIGYKSTVPYVYEGYGGNSATSLKTTSWFQGRTSGWLDGDVPPNSGTFQYIQGTGDLTNIIWFYNSTSKYMIKYDYSKFKYLNDITTDNRYNHNIDLLPTNPFLLNEKNDYEGHEVPWKFSKSQGPSGIVVDPDYVRPGRKVNVTMEILDTHSRDWFNPSGTPFNMNINNWNLGFSQQVLDKNYQDSIQRDMSHGTYKPNT